MTGLTDLCTTPACIQAASRILTNLHLDYKSIDPCTNFDAYACGGYPTEHPFESTDVLSDLQSQSRDVVIQLLTHPYNPRNDATSDDEDVFNMVAGDFAACLDVDAIEKGGLAGVPDMIAQVQKLFPIEDYNSNKTLSGPEYEKYADAVSYLNSIGTAMFGDFGTAVDVQNPNTVIPTFNLISPNSSDKALGATYDISSLATMNLTDIIEKIEVILPQAVEQGATRQLASSLLAFSAKLVGIYTNTSTPSLDAAQILYYTTTVAEADEAAPALGFEKVIRKQAPEGYKIDRMQIQVPDLWANVSTLLSQTPAATVQAATIFSTYGNYEPYIKGSVDPAKDRTQECAKYLDRSLAWIGSKLYLEQKYSDEDRDAVTTIMENLVVSFGERVKKVDWMDEATKTLVLGKLDKMTLRIGYPTETPDALNATSLKAYYKGVKITSSHFSNVLSIRKWYSNLTWEALSGPLDETTWPNSGVHSWIANARQWRERNTALIPAGISQSPLFSRKTPLYLSYGSLGYISGHEVTHGFDSFGRHFDQNTRLQEWWTESSADAFDNRTKCFVDQYSAVPAIGWDGAVARTEKNETIYVNGEFTLPENIADTGGLVTSYDAWKKLDDDSPQQGLPGLEQFTRDQLFFLAFGQTVCSRLTADDVAIDVSINVHAPNFARTRIPAQNSGAFREAFNCKKKEPTCELW
ncbi:hypothetical protein GQX73_g2815 [Xylaria multiplex]|uniref:Peptidase M13 N-terminal domain-containing protein n=1 Tax=Xylaria multiplex TaxID=323545 RepID=A0A7C8IV93_9PEZI|nr:hypothetical protein GQX73_g2815 [Xylaria multiplex]